MREQEFRVVTDPMYFKCKGVKYHSQTMTQGCRNKSKVSVYNRIINFTIATQDSSKRG